MTPARPAPTAPRPTRALDPTAQPSSRRRVVGLALVAALAVAVVIGAATAFGGPGRQVETGIVVAVQATSLSSVQGFSIRTTDGRTVDFRVEVLENASQFPIGHLSEHKVSLAPVRVTYVIKDGGNVAVRIEDAP